MSVISALRHAIGSSAVFLRTRCTLLIAWPIGCLIIGAAAWAVLLSHLDDQRLAAERAALSDAAQRAHGYARYVARMVDTVDQSLLHTRFAWMQSNATLRLDSVQELRLLNPPSLFNVIITDRHGAIATSTVPTTAKVTQAGHAFFSAPTNAQRDLLHIGAPRYNQMAGRLVIPLSRSISMPDGSFAGTVTVTVVPHYFSDNYDDAPQSRDVFFGVVGTDHISRVVRLGTRAPDGRTIPAPALPQFRQASGSVLLAGNGSFADRRDRYLGWEAVGGHALTAMVGLDRQNALAPYRERRAEQVLCAVWATLGLTAFAAVALALSCNLARRKEQLEATRATYRVATEGGTEGFYIVRPVRDARNQVGDFEIVDCNRRGAEFMCKRREELTGATFSSLSERSAPGCWTAMLRDAMAQGPGQWDVEIPADSPLTMRWARLTIVPVGDRLALTLQDISDTKAHVDELERRSNVDVLTGLPNRQWMQAYLPKAVARAGEARHKLAILFIDLDGFKAVNDGAGHAVGDELLRNAAARLNEAIRPRDHVVRLGGDEFLVVLEQVESAADAAQVAERILAAFRQKFRLSQGVHAVGTSIGVSLFPADGGDADTLLRNADVAMYSVKAHGKGNFRFYDQQFHDALLARLERETELRHAIDNDELLVYYQPRVDIASGATCGMEALVRWQHPSKGLIEPADFIPLAEQNGLITDLGAVVIDKVCAQLQAWARSGEPLLPVSINISPRQFNELDVAHIFMVSLARYGVDPSLIEIELTESSMMGDSAGVAESLAAIRTLGIKLSVDDFGTGYSSLSQLQRLDFDVLKVDQSFTVDIERSRHGSVFFKAIITMAHALGMRVVAEGVENERQISVLKSLQCDEIQGFYLSRPLPPARAQPRLPTFNFPVNRPLKPRPERRRLRRQAQPA